MQVEVDEIGLEGTGTSEIHRQINIHSRSSAGRRLGVQLRDRSF